MAIRLADINTKKSLPQVLFIINKVYGGNRTAQVYQKQLIYQLFLKIHENFMAKSGGGQDEFGDAWKPLAPSTVVRKLHRYLPRHGQPRASLTASQDLRWRGIYRSHLTRGASPSEAGRIAWGILKSQGARTAYQRLRGRKVPINIETHRLERSLRPNPVNKFKYRPYNKDQEVTYVGKSKVKLGTRVPYAKAVNSVRPFSYPMSKMQPWLKDGVNASVLVLTDLLRKALV